MEAYIEQFTDNIQIEIFQAKLFAVAVDETIDIGKNCNLSWFFGM